MQVIVQVNETRRGGTEVPPRALSPTIFMGQALPPPLLPLRQRSLAVPATTSDTHETACLANAAAESSAPDVHRGVSAKKMLASFGRMALYSSSMSVAPVLPERRSFMGEAEF